MPTSARARARRRTGSAARRGRPGARGAVAGRRGVGGDPCLPRRRRTPLRQALELWPTDRGRRGADRDARAATPPAPSWSASWPTPPKPGASWRRSAASASELGPVRGSPAPPGRRLRNARRTRRRLRRPAACRRRLPRGRPPREAAAERLAMANHRRAGGHFGEAVELAGRAVEDAAAPGAPTSAPGALGLLGVSQAKGGDYETGLETVRAGLALAIERDLTPVAAELYQRLSLVLYDSADYRPGRGGARHGADAVPDRRGRRHRGRLRHLPRLRAARARRMVAGIGALPAADRGRPGRLGRRRALVGAIQAFQGKARLGPPPALLLPRDRLLGRPLQHVHGLDDAPRPRRRGRRGRPTRPPSSAVRSSPAGRRATTTTTRSGACAGRPSFFARNGDRDGAHACARR